MSNVTKLAKSMSIKWADDPLIPQWNEEEEVKPQDPMIFKERITPPGGARQEEQDFAYILREQLNRAMNSIRSDYETLKNVPGALTKTPSEILEAFFKIWNDVQELQMSPVIDSNPTSAAIQFINLISDIKYSGIKTLISEKPISLQEIVQVMSEIIEESASKFYEGKFVPKITFAEELLKASNTISEIISKGR